MEESFNSTLTVDKLTYEALLAHFHPNSPNRNKPITDGTYTARYSGGNSTFIEFSKVDTEPEPKLSQEELIQLRYAKKASGESGWKFHVSINRDFYGGGYNALYDVLSANQVKGFKIANPYSPQWGDLVHSGRGVTIYAFKEPQRAFTQGNNNNQQVTPWEDVITHLSNELMRHEIIPGPRATGSSGGGTNERALENTPYVTYRYDHRPENVGGTGKIGGSVDPDQDLKQGPDFIGGLGPSEIKIKPAPLLNNHYFSSEKNENISNDFNPVLAARQKRKELHQPINTNKWHKFEIFKNDDENIEEKTQTTPKQNNSNNESCQPPVDKKNNQNDFDKDDNDKRITIGMRRGYGNSSS